jgi:hypothetical protein
MAVRIKQSMRRRGIAGTMHLWKDFLEVLKLNECRSMTTVIFKRLKMTR